MNTEKKISILKEMRKRIETGIDGCLCNAKNAVTYSYFDNIMLGDLGITKPANAGDPYWFPEYDKEPRLKLIDEALAKCETTFKVGDRVRVIKGGSVNNMGDIGVISEMSTSMFRVYVEGRGVIGNWLDPDSVELITETDPIKEAEQRVKDAQAELERLKNTPKDVKGLWKGQDMYYLLSDRTPSVSAYINYAYLSKERAEKELLRIRLAFIADSLNGGLFEPKDVENRYFLRYNQHDDVVDVITYSYTCFGIVLFKTRELAEQAMSYFTKDELIKMLS